ncbi:hypothetical protein ACFP3Q_11535 [Nocardioides sp. GCM10027113]|uniref:hypothetical protein n=1 Tax=unclassified Nocardioides TaxID=2615069 RepID=UPI00361F781B
MKEVAVYSPARARQLRVLLWAAVVVGAVLTALMAFVLVAGDAARYALVVGVPSLLLVAGAANGLRAMAERGFAARRWSVLTGAVLVVLGLFLTSVALGVLPSILGVLLLLMALLPDVGDQGGK